MHVLKIISIACVSHNVEFYGVKEHPYDRLDNICHTYLVTMHFSLLCKPKCNLYVI